MKTLSIICGSILIFCALIVLPGCGFIAINSNFNHNPGVDQVRTYKQVKRPIKAVKRPAKQVKKPAKVAKVKKPACQCPIKSVTIKIQ